MSVGAPYLPTGLGYRVIVGDSTHEPWVVLCGVPDPDETRGEVPNGFVVVLVPLADCLVEVVSEKVAALAGLVFWVSENASVAVPIRKAHPILDTAALAI